jgi:hypothetical protein
VGLPSAALRVAPPHLLLHPLQTVGVGAERKGHVDPTETLRVLTLAGLRGLRQRPRVPLPQVLMVVLRKAEAPENR